MEKIDKEKEQYLLHMWFGNKYWDSCCVDEALDWSQHDNTLSLNEIPEYIAWREDYLKTIEHLSKIVHNSEAFYALRPWSAAKENKVVVINNKTNKK